MWDRAALRRTCLGLLVTLVVLGGAAVWLSRSDAEQSPLLPALLAVAAVLVAVIRARSAYLLRISAHGMTLSGRAVPWRDIGRVSVAPGRLGVELVDGASLPSGMRARIVDPSQQRGAEARLGASYPARDDVKVRRAVQDLAPVGTEVTSG